MQLVLVVALVFIFVIAALLVPSKTPPAYLKTRLDYYEFFDSIPAWKWATGALWKESVVFGKRFCALGHLAERQGKTAGNLYAALDVYPPLVNDGKAAYWGERFPGLTPKSRILNRLKQQMALHGIEIR